MKLYERITDDLQEFIEAQHMFFVATAPLSADGHVNLSPKGLDSLRVIDDRTVTYLDHIGSGAETIAHVRENARITLMFCAFTGAPKIVRLHGHARIFEPIDDTFAEMRGLFPQAAGVRAIVKVAVERVSGSCGFGVPLFRHEGDRRQLLDWADRKGEQDLLHYQREKNHVSIDGLPALRWTEDVTV